ncbi:hypothetical protein M0802_011244 [Mischocyttarus mexicanus]|nr:hypothetical protein M0802_011244 [Mischocyttarus mexicanus]
MCWQERAELLLLRYASRWARRFVRRRLDLVIDSQDRNRSIAGLSVPPRHCVSARCPCQFIEDHLKYKPRGKLTLSRKTKEKKEKETKQSYGVINILLIIYLPCMQLDTRCWNFLLYLVIELKLNKNYTNIMTLRYPPGFTWCAYFNDPMVRFDAIPAY